MKFFADFYRVSGIPILWLARFTKDVLYLLSHISKSLLRGIELKVSRGYFCEARERVSRECLTIIYESTGKIKCFRAVL